MLFPILLTVSSDACFLFQGFRALLGEANAHLMKPVGNAGDINQQSLNFRLLAPNHAQAAPFVINCAYLFLITPPSPLPCLLIAGSLSVEQLKGACPP